MFKLLRKEISEDIDFDADEVIRDIEKVNQMLLKQEQKFNLTDDEDLLDSLIFEYNALEKHYRYLLKKAKELKIALPYHDRSKFT